MQELKTRDKLGINGCFYSAKYFQEVIHIDIDDTNWVLKRRNAPKRGNELRAFSALKRIA